MSEESLKDVALLRPETIATLRALEEPRFNWLGNVPLHALVELRRANENESFRRSLCRFTDELNQASLEDLDRVAAEVGRGIASLLAEHSTQVERLDAEFRGRFGLTAAVGLVTLAVALTPWLAPFIGPMTPATLAAVYGRDKIEFVRRRREATRSLAGVLAATNEESGAS
jgi:hypothetical protein